MNSVANPTPRYLITMVEPGFACGHMSGDANSQHLLRWHLRDSISDLVESPLIYKTNYVHEENLPDFLGTSDFLIVSPRMREVMRPFLTHCEFLPVELETTRGRDLNTIGGKKRIQGYSLLNCWLRLDLIDFERSDLDRISFRPEEHGTPVTHSPTWTNLVLHTPIPADAHLFGFERLLGEQRYISPALHSAMLAAGLVVFFRTKGLASSVWISPEEVRPLNPRLVHGLQKAPKPKKGQAPEFFT